MLGLVSGISILIEMEMWLLVKTKQYKITY
jgi:hypothetical protein